MLGWPSYMLLTSPGYEQGSLQRQMAARSSLLYSAASRQVCTGPSINPAKAIQTRESGHSPTMACGLPGMPQCDEGTPVSALADLGNLGLIIGCGSVQNGLQRLRSLLKQADSMGLSSPILVAAQDFADSFTFAVSFTDSWCASQTAEAQQHISAVSALISQGGGTVSTPTSNINTDAGAPSDGASITTTITTVAVAGAVIAGVVLLFPIVKEVVMGVAVKRKLRGG